MGRLIELSRKEHREGHDVSPRLSIELDVLVERSTSEVETIEPTVIRPTDVDLLAKAVPEDSFRGRNGVIRKWIRPVDRELLLIHEHEFVMSVVNQRNVLTTRHRERNS